MEQLSVKRVCLFAGYDRGGCVADYVLYYVKELSEIADVYYYADCEMKPEELKKLFPYVRYGEGRRHGSYDFGSWKELIRWIGWEALRQYDEMILCNDSCFGPVYPLMPIFNKADAFGCDFWGITEGHKGRRHLQSYFIVLKKKVFLSDTFKKFIDSVEAAGKSEIIEKYESVLTGALEDSGFKCAKLLKGSIGAYDKYATLLKTGSPFIKKLSFTETDKFALRESLVNWESCFNKYSGYDTGLIKTYLRGEGVPEDFYKSSGYRAAAFSYALKQFGKWLFDVRLGRKRTLIRVLGITFADRYGDSIPSFS